MRRRGIIRFHIITALFRRELLDTLRDKRTLFINFGVPIFSWPLLALLAFNILPLLLSEEPPKTIIKKDKAGNEVKKIEDAFQVALIGDEIPGLARKIEQSTRFVLVSLSEEEKQLNWQELGKKDEKEKGEENSTSKKTHHSGEHPLQGFVWPEHLEAFRKEAEILLKKEAIDLLVVQKAYPNLEKNYTNYKLFILRDDTNKRSRDASDYFQFAKRLARDIREQRLTAAGLDQGSIQPIKVDRGQVAAPERVVNFLMGGFLPYLLIVLVIMSCFYPAVDSTAGEKEHGTLATLLCSPIHSMELLFGKYLNVVLFSILGAGANFLSLWISFAIGLSAFGIGMNFVVPLKIFLILIPTAAFCSAVSITVAIFARNFKEGQNLMTPFILVISTPAFVTLIPKIELTPALALVPGVNISLLIKEFLLETATLDLAFLVLVSTAIYALVILVFAARVFASENVQLDLGGSLEDVVGFRRDRVPYPTPTFSILLFLLLLVFSFYGNLLLASQGIVILVVGIQLGIFLSVPLLFGIYFKFNLKEVLLLRAPSFDKIGGAILVGLTAWVIVIPAYLLLPAPPHIAKQFAETAQLFDPNFPLWGMVILLGVFPGVCEEIAFRGFIMSGFLKRMESWKAIGVTAILFGVAHYSIYRFFPTMIMGIVLGVVVWKTRNLWLGILIHAIHNALVFSVAKLMSQAGKTEFMQIPALTTQTVGIGIGGLIVFILGMRLLLKKRG